MTKQELIDKLYEMKDELENTHEYFESGVLGSIMALEDDIQKSIDNIEAWKD